MNSLSTRHIFCCQVTWTLRTTSSGVEHPRALSAKAITLCEVHCLGCHLKTWDLWTILARGRQRAVCDNQYRAICPGAWQVLDNTWSTKGVVRVLQWFQQDGATLHTSNESLAWLRQHFPDRLISRRCDPQWSPHSPHLNPQAFICGDTLRTGCMATTPRLSLTWRQQSQQQ